MSLANSSAGHVGGSESTDVFVSYAREDKEFVLRIHAALVENGRSAWVDWEGIPPSAQWRSEIETAIINGQSFVFVISPSSASSVVCAEESAIAQRHNKKIIPLVLVEVEHARLPDPISSRQWIFARAEDSFDAAFSALIETMDTDLDWVRTHTRLLGRALRWHVDKERASLLEGHELEDAETWLAESAAHEQRPTAEQAVFIAASRWRARLNQADLHCEEAQQLSGRGRLQAAAAHLLRAVELAPRGGAPAGYPATWEHPDWAEEAWATFQYLDAQRGRLRCRLAGHHKPISNLAVSGDGSLALSASFDGAARLWDLRSGTLLHVLSAHRGPVSAVAFSPTGEALTAGEDGALYGWDLADPKPKPLLPQASAPITAIAFDRVGRIIVGLQSGHVVILGDGGPAFHERMHNGSVSSIVLSGDGRKMATLSGRPAIGGWLAEGNINSWDFETKKERIVLFGTIEGRVVSVAISADGSKALRSLEGGAIEAWDLVNGKQIKLLKQPETARALCFSPDGAIAASGSDDSTIRLWSAHDWCELRVLDGHLSAVTALLFCDGGRTLLSGSIERTVAVWNLEAASQTVSIEKSSDGYGAVAVAHAKGIAALGRGDGQIQLWDSRTGVGLGALSDPIGKIVSVALSADGAVAVSGGDTGRIAIWDVKSGRQSHVLTGHQGMVWDLAFSRDATMIVSASADRTARIWDLASGKVRHILDGHTANVIGARFSPDGASVVTSSADASVRVWSVADGRQIQELRDGDSPNAGLDIAADGCSVLVGSNDGSIRLWDLARGRCIQRIKAHNEPVKAVALSGDAARGLSGSFDHVARYWNLQTGAQLAELAAHKDNIYGVALTPDGSALTASMDGVAAYWNLETGQPNGRLIGHEDGVSSVAVSADGSTVVTGSLDGTVRVWDGPNRSQIGELQVGHRAAIEALALSENGALLASGSKDRTLRIWREEQREQLLRRVLPSPPTSLTWRPDGGALLYGMGDRHNLVADTAAFGAAGGRIFGGTIGKGGAIFWDFASGPPQFLERHGGPISAIAMSPDGRRIFTASDDASVRVWDLASGRQIRLLKGHRDRVWGLAVSRDGRTVVTGSLDTNVRIWNLELGTTTKIIDGHTGGVGCVAVTAGDKQIVSASADKTVRFWDAKSGAQLQILEGHTAPVTMLAASLDGRTVITGSSNGDLRAWNLTGADAVSRPLFGHTDSINGLAITTDGRTAVSSSQDGTSRVWDLEKRETRHVLNAFNVPATKVAISPDNATAAVAYEDYGVRLWNLATGELAHILSGHRADVLCVAFAQSGTPLVSGASDAKVLVWDPQKDEPLRAIAGRLGDVLCVALNAEGTRALIGGETGLRLWDLALGEEIADLTGHTAPVTGVAFGPAGGMAASCSMDGSIRLWDLSRRRARHVLMRHKGPVVAIAFTVDGRVLLSGGEDGTISAWSVRTGVCLDTYGDETQHFDLAAASESGATMQLAFQSGDIPRALAASPNGRDFIVGSSQGVSLLSPFHPETPLDPPNVYRDGDPYRDFAALYASLGLCVDREDSDAGALQLCGCEMSRS